MTAANDKSKSPPPAADKTLNPTGDTTHNQNNMATPAQGTAALQSHSGKTVVDKHDDSEDTSKHHGVDSAQTNNDGKNTAAVDANEAAKNTRVAKDVSKMDTASESTAKVEKPTATASTRAVGQQPANSVGTSKSVGKAPTRSGAVGWVAGATAVIAVILAAALWWQNQRFEAVSREVATRLQTSDQQVAQLTRDVQSALSQSSKQSEQLTLLQRDVRTMRSEMTSIDQAWQSVSRTLDDRLLVSYLRRLLNLAQQLVLTGHVTGAISVLESSVEMVQGHHSPEQFVALATAIGSDLERLRAMPVVDVSELAVQLGKVVALVEKAPLQVPDRVAPGLMSIQTPAPLENSNPSAGALTSGSSDVTADSAWWEQWIDSARYAANRVAQIASHEFSDLMQVRRADTPQSLLLSEEQAMLVRTNLRSMLLSAQLALLNRQVTIWKAELNSVSDMLRTYYDVESTDVKAALALVQSLRESPVAIDAKPLTESLSALAVVAQAVTVPATSGESN